MNDILGIVLVFNILIWIVTSSVVSIMFFTGNTYVQKEKAELVEKCEKLLPRTEHCKLIAIPKSTKGETQ